MGEASQSGGTRILLPRTRCTSVKFGPTSLEAHLSTQNVVTLTWLYDATFRDPLLECLRPLIMERKARSLQGCQLVVHYKDEKCWYYLANHLKKVVFHLEDFTLFSEDIPDISGELEWEHVGILMHRHYWCDLLSQSLALTEL